MHQEVKTLRIKETWMFLIFRFRVQKIFHPPLCAFQNLQKYWTFPNNFCFQKMTLPTTVPQKTVLACRIFPTGGMGRVPHPHQPKITNSPSTRKNSTTRFPHHQRFIASHYQGLFQVKTESDFQVLPSMTYFFQKLVLSKKL